MKEWDPLLLVLYCICSHEYIYIRLNKIKVTKEDRVE